ncbi:MAG TPA: cysteine desulfurase family protein [Alphaproteobacteria bacterium]|jgi:cysteine desulfurase|nr:cysteine desulfurase [Micavibrio sp.]HQX27723.1 cysteine desulfurase family protein [Alphaproteobacteria bacterium]
MTGQNALIYLDYNATAPLRPEAVSAVNAAMTAPHNASSVHRHGRAAHKMIEDARINVAALVNCPPAQVIFNSGATEGNNTVLKYFAKEHILVSAIEHPSVIEAAPNAEKIPVDKNGIVDLNALEILLKAKKADLVSVMMVNNETGVIQPVNKISALAKKHGAFFHCDAVQAAGKIAVDMSPGHIDFLTLSAHKIGGPQGAGALCLGLCGITPTLLDGGGQEKKARPGTQNTAAIAGFGAAAALAVRDLIALSKKSEQLRNNLENALRKIYKDIVIHSSEAPRVPSTTLFSLPGASSETLLMAFDLENIALSNGSACASGSVKPSHVLKAMGADTAGTIRVSTGWASTQNDIDQFLAALEKITARLNRKTANA